MRILIPGVAWVALLTYLADWIGQYLQSPYASILVILVLALAKALQLWLETPAQAATARRSPGWWRWLVD